MPDGEKTKAELLEELDALRDRIARLEGMRDAAGALDEKWDSLVHCASDIIAVVERDGTILHINHTSSGVSGSAVIGRTIYDYVTPEFQSTLEGSIASVFKAGEYCHHEATGVGSDGEVRWYDVCIAPVRRDGKVVAAGIVARDIAERKKAEEALRQESERLASVLEHMPVMIDAFDSDGNIILWNRECERVTGFKAAEIVGNPEAMDLLYPDAAYRERMMRWWKLRGNNYRDWEWELTCKDGGKRFTLWSNISDKWPVRGWATWGIGVDITGRKRVEEELQQTRDRLQYILATSPAITYISEVGSGWAATFISKHVTRQFGHEVSEFLDDPHFWSNHIHPDDKEHVFAGLRRLQENDSHTCEYRFRHRDGSYRWVHDEARLVRDERGKAIECVGYLTDITGRKRTEEELMRSENNYRMLFENSPDPIAKLDEKWRLVAVNPAMARSVGLPMEEMIGKTAYDLISKDVADKRTTQMKKAVRERRPQFFEDERDGRHFHHVFVPVAEPGGRTTIQIIARDITAVKKAHEDLSKYRERIAQAEHLASIGTLSATLVHRLNQPLTVVRLSIQNALAQLSDVSCQDKVAQELKAALSGVSQVSSTVDQIRALAKGHSKQKHRKRVNIRRIADKTMRSLAASAREANIAISIEGLDSLPSVYMAEGDLEQLFFCLIENAIQAADGKEKNQIVISGASKGKHVELRFSDDCCGIRPEDFDQLFDPFFTTRAEGKGTGLGLCIVQDIASESNGSVWVKNNPGKGTTFFVTLSIDGGEKS
ncbi:MAG: PAS domain S-box protein [Phycisphaerales bacterium]|nr:MAG: PAS domain S-box protein [Phycisphaerales bacterium]